MYNYFKNIAEKSSCALSGACSVHPSISAMYDILVIVIREISFYIVKLKEFGLTNKPAMAQTLEALSVFIINTSISHQKYLELINRLNCLKNEIKGKYTSYCHEHDIPCVTISEFFEIKETTTLSDLIKFAENASSNKQKNSDKTKQNLFELIILFSKICAINICKIKRYYPDFDDYDFEVLRFFALLGGYSIRCEKVIRRIKEFSNIALLIRQKLFSISQERYGKKQNALISTSEQKGACVLVSGDDLYELEKLLIEADKLEEDISIYTNGALFVAHFYPYFKNHRALKGHWGGDDAQYDFAKFPGSVLLTRNFLQKIDSLYKGEIFSNKLISFSRFYDIKDDDYYPVIKTALELEGFSCNVKREDYALSYDIDKISSIIEDFDEDEIVLIAGTMDDETLKRYDNKTVLNFNCPQETDLLLDSIQKLREKGVKISVFFPQCNLESFNTTLSLLGQEVRIFISNCSNMVINPHVIEALKDSFGVEVI